MCVIPSLIILQFNYIQLWVYTFQAPLWHDDTTDEKSESKQLASFVRLKELSP